MNFWLSIAAGYALTVALLGFGHYGPLKTERIAEALEWSIPHYVANYVIGVLCILTGLIWPAASLPPLAGWQWLGLVTGGFVVGGLADLVFHHRDALVQARADAREYRQRIKELRGE